MKKRILFLTLLWGSVVAGKVIACEGYEFPTFTVTPEENNYYAPVVTLSMPSTGTPTVPVSLNTSASDGDGDALTVWWNFGDCDLWQISSPGTLMHTYATGGTYTVQVQVTDGRGRWTYSSKIITISGTPPETIFDVLTYQDRAEHYWDTYKTLKGDVNGDGRADLVWNETAYSNRIYVNLAQANGTFLPLPSQVRTEVGWDTYKTLIGDVNGDGFDDLIWNATTDTNRIYVGLGQADGTFQFLPPQVRSETGWSPYKTITGDVNGDGRTDLIWNETSTYRNRVYIGLGQSNGTFVFLAAQDRSGTGWDNYKTLAEDVNGDGLTDLIWNQTTTDLNRVYVGLAQPNGTFVFLSAQDRSGLGWDRYTTLMADVNGDGRSDLIWNEASDVRNRVYVGLAQANGTFQFLSNLDLGIGNWTDYQAMTGDVNGDGLTDLIWNRTVTDFNRIYVCLALASGTFSWVYPEGQGLMGTGWDNYQTLPMDVNGDGKTDLVWNQTKYTNRTYVGLSKL